MPKLLLIGLTICLLATASAAEFRPFAELWNYGAYCSTNLERKNFSAILARYEGKLGLYLGETPIQLYGVYYGVSSQSNDYWDNAIYSGAGIRTKPFIAYQGNDWHNEWIRDIKIFAETLSANYLKDKASGEANKMTDVRYGLELWHEWNLDKPDLNNFWGELWSIYSCRTTNFSYADFDTYILFFQPKLGRHLGRGIEVYLKSDLTASGKADYWLNTLDYGLGIRFEPWRQMIDHDSLLKKFKMFAEVLSASYLKDKPTDPNKNVTSDVRFGVEFSYGR